ALKEAVAHYSNALRLVLAMPDGKPRDELELGVRLELGLAEQIRIGPTAKESGAHYHRALALAEARPEKSRELFLATWGVWFHTTMMGRTQEAFQRADELLVIARELDNPDLLLEAYHARVPGLLRTADYVAMK